MTRFTVGNRTSGSSIRSQGEQEGIDRLTWLVTLAFFSLICLTATDAMGRYILIGVALVIFGLYAYANGGRIRLSLSCFHVNFFLLGAYSFLSTLWAMSSGAAITKGVTIFLTLICMTLIYVAYQGQKSVWELYNIIRWASVLVCFYTIITCGVGEILNLLQKGDRLIVDFANINTVALLASYSIVISFFELLFRKKRPWILLMLLPSFVVIAAAATKKSLLILLLGIVLLVYLRYKRKDAAKNLINLGFIGAVLVICLVLLFSLPIFDNLLERMEELFAAVFGEGETDISTRLRQMFIEVGMNQFRDTPVLGIGIGSSGALLSRETGYDTYTHNNFVELLCCGGIVGFAIYYSMHLYCFVNLFRHRDGEDSTVKLSLIMILIQVLMDFGMVSYYSKATMFYFMVFSLHVKQLKAAGQKT